ncbi:hypothetical protein DY218_28610 [Streptomyces triticagri]|uniref:Uncharacterized protein n=1 Tax=Streptomyces triticagri TaxID=2293568 RepID=A0A372LX76_9ACTN|nr:hypothetical protein [Streptomyces triticagri]RFU83272.1 hypothetical protein DY218_28610 [Streptomyces triticagri]
MALTNKDPHNAREIARVIYLSGKAMRRQSRGKSTKAIDSRIDAIREKAQARENARSLHRR